MLPLTVKTKERSSGLGLRYRKLKPSKKRDRSKTKKVLTRGTIGAKTKEVLAKGSRKLRLYKIRDKP